MSNYRVKLALVFLLVSFVPFTGFYAYYFRLTYNNRRAEILQSADVILKSGVEAVNDAYRQNVQKLETTIRNFQIQRYLRSDQQVHLTQGLLDFFYNLDAIYDTIRDNSLHWRLRIYSMNPGLIYGSFIDDIYWMDAERRDWVLGMDSDAYLWRYEDGIPGFFYINRRIQTAEGQVIAIAQVRIGFDYIRERLLRMEPPSNGKVLYLVNGTQPVPLTENARDFSHWDADSASGYYHILSAELAANDDAVVLLLPRSYVRAQLTDTVAYFAIGYAALTALYISLIFVISKLLSQRILTENKALELELLQSLINPHFLYNTLRGIKLTFRDKRLTEVIDALVRYYRIALNMGNNILTVALEIEMLRSYLEIQKFMYEAEINYEIDVNEEVRCCRMIKNLLQPVVENAVLHGIKQRPGERITISGGISGDDMFFSVTDNGTGMTPEKCSQILRGEHTALSGYGLYNIQRRIRLYYGENCGLDISSEPGLGTTVVLRLKKEISPEFLGAKQG
jgi:signal transduction histidine kinase